MANFESSQHAATKNPHQHSYYFIKCRCQYLVTKEKSRLKINLYSPVIFSEICFQLPVKGGGGVQFKFESF